MAKLKRTVKKILKEEAVYSKPITASQTFWGSTLMAFLIIGFIGYDGFKNGLTVIHGAIIPAIFTGYIATLQGRIKANQELPVYTPDWLPGPNEVDMLPDTTVYSEGNFDSAYIPDKD